MKTSGSPATLAQSQLKFSTKALPQTNNAAMKNIKHDPFNCCREAMGQWQCVNKLPVKGAQWQQHLYYSLPEIYNPKLFHQCHGNLLRRDWCCSYHMHSGITKLSIENCVQMMTTWHGNPSRITDPLTHWGWDKMAAVSQTTLSNTFSWVKMLEFRLKFHWSVFLRVKLTIIQHCVR